MQSYLVEYVTINIELFQSLSMSLNSMDYKILIPSMIVGEIVANNRRWYRNRRK